MKKINEVLGDLGIEEKEIEIYLAAIKGSPCSVIDLAKRTGMKRTSVYNFMNGMIQKGIILPTAVGGKFLYAAANPEDLIHLLDKKKEKLMEIVPELSMMFTKSGSKRPKIKFYEGVEGGKTVYNDIIDQPEGGSMLFVSSFEDMTETLPASFLDSFFKRKVRNKIWAKGIIPSGKFATERTQNNKKEMRESIVVPVSEFPIRGEVIIYEDKVAITSLSDEKISVIIESKQNADNQRAIINLLWKCLKLLEKHKIKLS